MDRYDVLITGAGPTGMVLALALAKQGARVCIVDKAEGPGSTSRAMAVQARTLELYRPLGLADEMAGAGRPNPGINLWVRGKRRARLSLRDAGARLTPYPYVLIYPQDAHEQLLVRHLEAAGVSVRRRTELAGFEEKDDHVLASLRRDEGEDLQVAASYLASRALFAEHGVAADDVFVQDIVRRPRKVDQLPAGEPAPMETRVAMHITVRDLTPWTAMLRTLLAMKDIESLAVSFSRSDRDQVEADLVTQALALARTRAQNIARSIKTKLGPATGVALQPLKNLSNAMGLATEPSTRYTGGRNTAPPDPALVQSMRLVQSADVIYRIGR